MLLENRMVIDDDLYIPNDEENERYLQHLLEEDDRRYQDNIFEEEFENER